MTLIMKFFLRQAARIIVRIFVSPMLHLVYSIFGIRLIYLITARIAHLAWNTAVLDYNLNFQQKKLQSGRVLLFAGETCNEQLLRMWMRRLPIIQSRLIGFIFNADREYLMAKPFLGYPPFKVTEFQEINLIPPLEFTAQENSEGYKSLAEMGLSREDWFVCIHARDDIYHSQVRSDHSSRLREINDKSHRNADISTYISAAKYISDQGGFALRVGWGVRGVLPEGNPRIIDYARNYRNDFDDIFLAGKCRFFLASGAGLMAVPVMFGVPVILTNMLPPRLWPLRQNSFILPKLLRCEKSGELVPYSVLQEYGMFTYDFYKAMEWDSPAKYAACGLIPVDNSSEEITAACDDMFRALNGEPIDPAITELLTFYKKNYCQTTPDALEHGPNLSPSFAAKYADIIVN